jgi:2-polyprenyl-3-methyl-5-hydroxy-6-metoxy-1,4-benzoquinol methylase
MLLTLTSTSPPATDLGYLLHKNPAAVRSVPMSWGSAHVFYPEAAAGRCTAALLCEVDPVGLVRRSRSGPFPLAAYVNDRPYAASSLLAVAMRKVFGTALRGECRERPDLPGERLRLSAHLPALPCRGGAALLRRVLEPLGYEVSATAIPLDETLPGWGDSPYFSVRLSATCRVQDLLGQLYVLLPVFDDDKHYWVSKDEITKLTGAAGEWLAGHPERDLIIRRYLRHQPGLVAEATARLLDEDRSGAEAEAAETVAAETVAAETVAAETVAAETVAAETVAAERDGEPVAEHTRLRDLRVAAVVRELTAAGARRVLDLGCGDGRLLAALLTDPRFEEITGVDASAAALDRAARRLHLDEMAPRQKQRIRLLLGALTYTDRRLAGYDAAVLAEVIEHVDPERLAALEQAVFGAAAPSVIVVTTPNAEYNPRYPGLAAGALRHPDHRFEWTRAQFRAWADSVAARYGYAVRYSPVGEQDPEVGPPTQLAVLARGSALRNPHGATMSPERQAARPHRAELTR